MDDMKNGKKSTNQGAANKRYSIDNYCSKWLSTACKSAHIEPDSNNVTEKLPATNDKASTGHEQHKRVFEANKLHRRSLSENIIPFPPHTTPSDKARCHLINRRNSHLNTSSGLFMMPILIYFKLKLLMRNKFCLHFESNRYT